MIDRPDSGYNMTMKFLFGFITGVAVGGYLASNMTEQQRSKVADVAGKATGSVTQSKVGSAVAENASKVSGQVSDRVAKVVDNAGDKITETVSSAETSGNGPTTTNV
jgi:hypothetical protein